MRYRKFLRGHSATLLCVLTSVLPLLILTLSPSSAKEPTDADQLNRLLFEHPALELTPDTWKIIQTRQKGSTARLSGQLLIIVEKGTIRKIGVLKSTGDPKLDAASVRWVKENWVFTKDQTGL